MMTRKMLLLLAVVILFAVVSCTPQQPETPPGPAVETQITASTAPDSGTVGEKMEFGWGITAEEGTIATNTAVRYGTESTPGALGKDVSSDDTSYVSATKAHVSTALPSTFTSSLYPTSEGTLYYRFHAVINGENYWSDEYSAEIAALEVVEGAGAAPEEDTKEGKEDLESAEGAADYAIIVKEFEFEPAELTIQKGQTVQWKNERTAVQRGMTQLFRLSSSRGFFDFKSPRFYNGETFEYTFNETGKLVYKDVIYVQSGVIGTITVNP